ncbi:MAG: copper resistance protein B [Sideroxydans sp.]|nr:copper resistance protein B [Sideroxydans sp.]
MNKHMQFLLAVVASVAAVPVYAMGGGERYSSVMLDRLEVRNSNAGNSSYWEGQGWVGGDLDKAWFKTQGDIRQGKAQTADAQLLYSRAIAPYWDAQFGARHDFALNGQPARDWLAFAFKGLAPYRFDVDASAYLGNGGMAARLKSGYTLLLTQRLSLLPEIEANLYGKADPARALGSGLSNIDLTLRLRYEVSREFAPYVGVMWSNKYGGTASFARQNGERAGDVYYAAGVRIWW